MKSKLLKIIYYFYKILAKLYIKKHKPFVIWITWSVWKTWCRTIVYNVLKNYLKDKVIYSSPKNYNSELWLVFSIFNLENYSPWVLSLIKIYFKFLLELFIWKKKYDVIVLEYWIDHPGDMDFLLSIVKPDFSIFTKMDYIHVENFDSIEDILEEKMKLIHETKDYSFINYSDEYQKDYSSNIFVDYSYYNKDLNYSFEYKKSNNKIYSFITIWTKTVQTNLLGSENFVYLLLALDLLKKWFLLDYEDNDYISFDIQKWRFDIYEWINESTIVDSSYNAWPQSVLKMIDNTLDIKKNLFQDYKVLFVLWDMRELWVNSASQHKKIFQYANKFGEIVSVWKETKEYFWEHLWNFKYSIEAGEFLKKYIELKNDKFIILFKWSQNTIFLEESIKVLLKNPLDRNNLVRQDPFWIEKKKNY